MSSAISLPIMSGRVEMSWPSLIKEGPNSLRAEEILIPSESCLFACTIVKGANKKVKILKRNLNLILFSISIRIL